MNEKPEEKLARIRREYFLAIQSIELKMLIEGKRDILENTIRELQRDIEQETFKLHRTEHGEEENVKKMSNENDRNKQLLDSVTRTKRELDAKLDEFELLSAEMLILLKRDLIEAILHVHPELKNQYEELEQAVHKKESLFTCLVEIETVAEQVSLLLDSIENQRLGVKKRSILKYLFGTNPNYAISKYLNDMKEIISKAFPVFDRLEAQDPYNKPFEKISRELLRIFKHLHTEAQSRWGWGTLDKKIIPYCKPLKELRKQLQGKMGALGQEIDELNSQIDEWIVKNSTQ